MINIFHIRIYATNLNTVHLYLMQGQKYAKNEIELALFEVGARLG